MPKIKLPTKSPHIDMTPMVDLFSVVLTFLMLTTTMRQPEPAPVDTPFSISEKPTPDFNTMTLLLSKDDKVFLNFDNGPDTLLKYRPKILVEMGKRYGIEFTEAEQREFEKYPSSIGVAMNDMKAFLDTQDNKERSTYQNGIPIDSTDNQLANWVLYARQVNPNIQACIKGDATTGFPLVQKVLDIMQDKNVNKFNLITSLEAAKINLDEIQK
ncbi:MAG TPA: biopolymer transporter ExbD [Bacteroidales bacterium]|jgi:biopolymer transport protein ExbD|nr:biopolymer transporter ExbD [Bacteroidales bacterium]